jgi:hypothetical protein
VLPRTDGPLVLVSAGIGVTPMVSMLHALVDEGCRRPVWFVHGAHDGAHHPLAHEARTLAAGCPAIRVHVAYSQPLAEDALGADYDSQGRVDDALLAGLTGGTVAHYMLCGPVGFMAAVQTGLERRGVPASEIHTESFGPSR